MLFADAGAGARARRAQDCTGADHRVGGAATAALHRPVRRGVLLHRHLPRCRLRGARRLHRIALHPHPRRRPRGLNEFILWILNFLSLKLICYFQFDKFKFDSIVFFLNCLILFKCMLVSLSLFLVHFFHIISWIFRLHLHFVFDFTSLNILVAFLSYFLISSAFLIRFCISS